MKNSLRRMFMGQDDPDRISLERVFPFGDLIFSMPFEETGRQHRIIVEGNQSLLEQFENHADVLTKSQPDNYGRWVALIDGVMREPSLQIIYEPADVEIVNFRLLVFVLRADLVKICNFRLCLVSHVIATKSHVVVLHKPAPLPESIGNGFLELLPPSVPLITRPVN